MSYILIYCCYYFEPGNISDWAQVFAAGLIAFFVYKYTKRLQRESVKPIIAFIITKDSNPDYLIENVGKGAAINPVIYSSKSDEIWEEKVQCNSMGPNANLKIHWTSGVKYLGAYYEDIYGEKFYCFMRDNKMKYYKIKEIKNTSNPFNWSAKLEKRIWEL